MSGRSPFWSLLITVLMLCVAVLALTVAVVYLDARVDKIEEVP